jgi:hypothetical protein
MIQKGLKYILLGFVLIFMACSEKNIQPSSKLFTNVSYELTGVDFINTLTENDSLNYFTYSYLYMGGGISVGDINNDGLKDLFFTGNQVSNKLYLNKGNLKFEDVTESARISGDQRWYTGTTMVDVNNDGLLDVYCSVGGKFTSKNNQLFVNNGDATFTERAAEYGIDDAGNSVQATFFDYDKDGDLDLYVANYPPTKFNLSIYGYKKKMELVKDHETDHLYRNDEGVFTDVTNIAGVRSYGLSLSATVGDLNNDSWPDLYVSNDFSSPDLLYINNQDGTFKEVVKEATGHTAMYGMGVDIADFNNDGNLDIFQVDMDANTNKRKKANMATMAPELFWQSVEAGFYYQYMQNCMQLNTGVFDSGVPYFSDVSRITGTSSTDWSWGPLFADFDNDGLKDLFVSNGTRREINNNDYFNSLKKDKLSKDKMLEKSMEIPSEKIDNFMFQNKGNLEFEQVNKEWGVEYKGFSNGVVYADLDNDGDLEIVTNNIDDYASFFENKSSEMNNFIKVRFIGSSKNKFGLGNRVFIETADGNQMQELTLTRGFQSSVAPELHFGVKKNKTIAKIKVIWSTGKEQEIKNINVNQTIVFDEVNANVRGDETVFQKKIFTTESSASFPKVKHEENKFDDFEYQVLLPHKMSSFGPALAVADVNNDGLEDYFIGGAFNKEAALFFQTEKGFVKQKAAFLSKDKLSEDVHALFFDADNDGDNDLYVVSGGYEFSPNSENLQDRMYLNNGTDGFTKASSTALPKMITSGAKVYNLDFDNDGRQDLLVLGRQVPGNYPSAANTYLLKNETKNAEVKFTDVTKLYGKEFQNLGMATDAVISDINNDGLTDIIIVGEWMPIRVFQNEINKYKEVSEEWGVNDTTGWWWSIEQGDFDNDGDMDYIVGNNGLNYKYQASETETFDIYVKDFDQNNKNDLVLSYYNEGKQYPVRGRGCSSQQIPGIKSKYKNYESFSDATLVDVYSQDKLDAAIHHQVKSFASVYLENKNGNFEIHKLPNEVQISSINKILVDDYNKDGSLDFLVAGNLFASEIETPRNDASCGMLVLGNSKGKFKVMKASDSGFFVKGDVKDMSNILISGKKHILVGKNDDFVQFISVE